MKPSTERQQEGACKVTWSTHAAFANTSLPKASSSTPGALWQTMSVSAELKA